MGKGKSFKKGHWSNCVSEKQPQTHTENTLVAEGEEGWGGKDPELGLGLQTVRQDGKPGPLWSTGSDTCGPLSRSAVQQKSTQHCNQLYFNKIILNKK